MEYLITLILLFLSAMFWDSPWATWGSTYTHSNERLVWVIRMRNASYPCAKKVTSSSPPYCLETVAVNAVLAIFLGSIASGVTAGIIATTLIFLFGEIIPQATISRHALRVGAFCAPFVRALLFITYPIVLPISYILDRVLGQETQELYTKREIMEIISEHEDSEHSSIDHDEERIVHGALQFSHKPVSEVMTKRNEVATLRASQVLDDTLMRKITEEGFSRYPVMGGTPKHVVGILYTKDLLIAKDNSTVLENCEERKLHVRPDEKLDTVLAYMLKRQQHMAIVSNEIGTFMGVITLEDIIEEVIQQEILDEDDNE